MSNYGRKGSKLLSADQATTIPPAPRSLEHLEIHLDPFTVDGRTYRVFGTQTERQECRFDREGVPHIVTVNEHRHHVLCVETDERWWMPHERVKKMQIRNF